MAFLSKDEKRRYEEFERDLVKVDGYAVEQCRNWTVFALAVRGPFELSGGHPFWNILGVKLAIMIKRGWR